MCKLIVVFFALISAATAIFLSEDFLKAALINAFGGPAVPISPALPPVGLIGPAIGPPVGPHPPFPPQSPLGIKGGCPLCDRSVYSYCYDKMLHDACCCNNGNAPFNCPPFDDCSYLNAKSCAEHALLFTCCCNNPYH